MCKLLLVLVFISSLMLISNKKHSEPFKGEYCRILALEGGGDNGAYQAGALKGLFEKISSDQDNYDVITGVSLGAFNAAILATFKLGDEKQAADLLVSIWSNIKEKDIYKNWAVGIVQGMLFEEGFYNNAPFMETCNKIFKDRELQRDLFISALNAGNLNYEYFDTELIKKYGVCGAINASSSYSPLFPSGKYLGNRYYDGSIKYSIDFVSAITECVKKGYSYDKIVLDAVLCNSNKLRLFDNKNFHPIESLLRLVEILAYDNESYEQANFKRLYPDVILRNVIYPTKEFPRSKHPYDFDANSIKFMIDLGYNDALQQVKP